jgi:hypothetical protein
VRVAKATHATALAFGPDGALYVTAVSDASADQVNRGVLLKITGDL